MYILGLRIVYFSTNCSRAYWFPLTARVDTPTAGKYREWNVPGLDPEIDSRPFWFWVLQHESCSCLWACPYHDVSILPLVQSWLYPYHLPLLTYSNPELHTSSYVSESFPVTVLKDARDYNFKSGYREMPRISLICQVWREMGYAGHHPGCSMLLPQSKHALNA